MATETDFTGKDNATTSANDYTQLILDTFYHLIQQTEQDLALESSNTIRFKLVQYRKAWKNLQNITITSLQDVRHLPGIGKGILRRIEEIMTTGTLSELRVPPTLAESQHHKAEAEALQQLMKITGIGPSKARQLLHKGITLHALLQRMEVLREGNEENEIDETDKIEQELTHHQLVGLRYWNDLQERIPRSEIDRFQNCLYLLIHQISDALCYEICGSYRRGHKDSGDIDLLITHPGISSKEDLKISTPYLRQIVENLTTQGIIIDHLTRLGNSKFMGVIRIPHYPRARRLDIRFVSWDTYIPALLYFTGSASENIRLRKLAIQKGYKINEYGVFKKDSGERIILHQESDLYHLLGEPYREPTQR